MKPKSLTSALQITGAELARISNRLAVSVYHYSARMRVGYS